MRTLPVLVLVVAAACSKSEPSKKEPASGTGKASTAAAAATPPAAKEKKPPPPPTPTGVLDLEIQRMPADGATRASYHLLMPKFSQQFRARPKVERQDTPTPDGLAKIASAFAISSVGETFDGLIYVPIPEDIEYDVPKGLKGARDGMLKMMKITSVKDEESTLGPLKANHVTATGSAQGQKLRVEAWIAFDDASRTLYGLMALRKEGVRDGIDALHAGFTARDAKPEAPAAATN